ncbi:hypothetical protein ABW21_db0206979 [Orbilia brochopaga]|nr:hypothetical protein ABW21_db0206979 [Drechslerella brochopaga]
MGFLKGLSPALWLVLISWLAYDTECRRIGTVEYDIDYDERTTPVQRAEFDDWTSPEWKEGTCINLPGSDIYSHVLTQIWYDPSNVNPEFPYFVQGIRIWTGPDCEGYADDFLRIEKDEPFRVRMNLLEGSDSGDEDSESDEEMGGGNGEWRTIFGGRDFGDRDTMVDTPAGRRDRDMEVESDSGYPFLFENTPSQPPSRRLEVMGDYNDNFIFDEQRFQEFARTVPNFRSDIQIEGDQNLLDLQGNNYVPPPGGNDFGLYSNLGSPGSYDTVPQQGEAAGAVYINTDGQPNPDANGIYHYKFWTDDDLNGDDWNSPLSIKIITDYNNRYQF